MKAVFCALLLAIFLAGCGSAAETPSYTIAEAGSWSDGIYTTKADGRVGSYDVKVTIEDGYISAIDASDNKETEAYGGAAIETMIPAMIAEQSYDVDIVSGATTTSEGLRDAVARCLQKASEK